MTLEQCGQPAGNVALRFAWATAIAAWISSGDISGSPAFNRARNRAMRSSSAATYTVRNYGCRIPSP
jgi:hypothetical protein